MDSSSFESKTFGMKTLATATLTIATRFSSTLTTTACFTENPIKPDRQCFQLDSISLSITSNPKNPFARWRHHYRLLLPRPASASRTWRKRSQWMSREQRTGPWTCRWLRLLRLLLRGLIKWRMWLSESSLVMGVLGGARPLFCLTWLLRISRLRWSKPVRLVRFWKRALPWLWVLFLVWLLAFSLVISLLL